MLVPVNQIHVSGINPVRDQYINELAIDIETHGMISPIFVDNDFNLISGRKRFAVAKLLGWDYIEAQFVQNGYNPDDFLYTELNAEHRAKITEAKRKRVAYLLSGDKRYSKKLHSMIESSLRKCTLAHDGFEWIDKNHTLDKYFEQVLSYVKNWTPLSSIEYLKAQWEYEDAIKRDKIGRAITEWNSNHPSEKLITDRYGNVIT